MHIRTDIITNWVKKSENLVGQFKKEKSLRKLFYIFAFAALGYLCKSTNKIIVSDRSGAYQRVGGHVSEKQPVGASYEIKGVEIETALESDVISEEQKLISGWNLSLMKSLNCRKRVFGKPYFIYSPFSDLLTETNWGVLMGTTFNKLSVSLGAGFRRMTYSEEIAPEEKPSPMYENFILLYHLKYSFLNEDSK